MPQFGWESDTNEKECSLKTLQNNDKTILTSY